MKIYIIQWLWGDVNMYVFPQYIDSIMNKFFTWSIEHYSYPIEDIEKAIYHYGKVFRRIRVDELPEEIRENFDFKRRLDARGPDNYKIYEFLNINQ